MIEAFWNICLLHDITTRDQLLREAIRVTCTKHLIEKKSLQTISENPKALFQLMEEQVGYSELGKFSGDHDLFHRLYLSGQNLDLLEYAAQTIQQDRVTGSIIIHPEITTRFITLCKRHKFNKILFAEAEKYLRGLIETECYKSNFEITLLTENYIIAKLFKTYFRSYPNVLVIQGSIYQPIPFETKFQAIISMPNLGMKINGDPGLSIRESEAVAAHHLASLLQGDGKMSMTFPSRILFQSGELATWREHMNKNFPVQSIYALPEGFFRPVTSVKTYQVKFGKSQPHEVLLGKLYLRDEKLSLEREVTVHPDQFVKLENWQIESLLNTDQETLQLYQQADVPKIKLREVAEVFRGKSVLKQDLKPGSVKVLNISNLDNGEVIMDKLETIDEEERKISRYRILPGDLVMTCRGTVNKFAVFPETEGMVIASANIIVIRFKTKIINHYAKIFFESPTGMTILKSLQRGTTVMNLNPSDVAEIEIPLISEEQQLEKIQRYLYEKARYDTVLKEATERWEQAKKQIYEQLY